MRRHRQIALLGYPGVGKSSLAHHFVYKQFSDVYDPNIKTSKKEFFWEKKKKIFRLDLQHQFNIGDEQYDLLIVDNAGSDQYTIHHSDFDNSDAYILIYAIDDRQRLVFILFRILNLSSHILVLIWYQLFEINLYQQVQWLGKKISFSITSDFYFSLLLEFQWSSWEIKSIEKMNGN